MTWLTAVRTSADGRGLEGEARLDLDHDDWEESRAPVSSVAAEITDAPQPEA
jgi:hypothetical protein